MRIRTVLMVCTALAIASVALSDDKAPEKSAAPATAAAAKPTALGKTAPAAWSATTMEAATTEAQKKKLSSGKPVTVTGEVVDVSCYMQLGKRGEAHIACGTKCIANGQPIGIVDADDNLYIVMPEQHHPRRDGQADIRTLFAQNLAKTVTVNGMMTEMKGYRALFVDAEDLGAMAKPAAPASK